MYRPWEWTTEDEIAYIDGLAQRLPDLARRYCQLILRCPRRWDPTVDVPAVHAYCEEMLTQILR